MLGHSITSGQNTAEIDDATYTAGLGSFCEVLGTSCFSLRVVPPLPHAVNEEERRIAADECLFDGSLVFHVEAHPVPLWITPASGIRVSGPTNHIATCRLESGENVATDEPGSACQQHPHVRRDSAA